MAKPTSLTYLDILIGDAKQIWKKSRNMEQSACECKKETGCDENCWNRIMNYECTEKNCPLPAHICGNRSFADLQQRKTHGSKYQIGVEVLKTDHRGYGLRSNRTFNPNQIIVEYTGEIITKEEAENRMRNKYYDSDVRT